MKKTGDYKAYLYFISFCQKLSALSASSAVKIFYLIPAAALAMAIYFFNGDSTRIIIFCAAMAARELDGPLDHPGPEGQIFGVPGSDKIAVHRLPTPGVGGREKIPDLRVRGIAELETLGHRFHGQAEDGVGRDVFHLFPADINASPVFQALPVLRGRADAHGSPPEKFHFRFIENDPQ
jgi:hypothetical protein